MLYKCVEHWRLKCFHLNCHLQGRMVDLKVKNNNLDNYIV